MKTIYLNKDNLNILKNEELDITIGAYDGIHQGHLEVLKALVSGKVSKHTAVLTFLIHPDIYLHKRSDDGFIESLKEKEDIFKNMNIDYLIILNNDILNYTYLEFNSFLKEINVKRVVVGCDFVYGKGAKGSVTTLEEDFLVTTVDLVKDDKGKLSSSDIRKALQDGNIKKVNELLENDFSISGKVLHGEGIGKSLGFKTANLSPNNIYHDLRKGVYEVNVIIDKKSYLGIANFGFNPSLNEVSAPRLEVHIFDYDKDLYDKNIKVVFVSFIRDEMKFQSKEELIEQIKRDIKIVRG